mmetsp:Transcript_8977/g.14399  ORF Transcript_8977/g.14399 Transcript_8977/m.14399 type:complete len:204 (-) Transcript_8977:1005-1616(-)
MCLEWRIKVEFNFPSILFLLRPCHDGSTASRIDASLFSSVFDHDFFASSLHVIVFVENNNRRTVEMNDDGIKLAHYAVGQGQSTKVASKVLSDIQKQRFTPHDMRLDLGRDRHGWAVEVGVTILDGRQHNVKRAKVETDQQTDHSRSEVDVVQRNEVPIFVRVLRKKVMQEWSSVSLEWLVQIIGEVYRLKRRPAKKEFQNIP